MTIENPAILLEAPKIGRKLPVVLSVPEIDAIIGAIDLSTSEGQRNKAIIETLYGCGLRVSELVNLKITDIFAAEGFIRVKGKGNKERLVPIGSVALREIDSYFSAYTFSQPPWQIAHPCYDFHHYKRTGRNCRD